MFEPSAIPAIVSRWFHLGAVIVAIGGTVFLRVVLHQAARQNLPDREHAGLMSAIVARWSRILHTCIAVILLTGGYNAWIMLSHHRGQAAYHSIFGLKVLLAFALFFLAIALTGRSRVFAGLRENRAKWMAVNIALAGVIVLLSNLLRYIPLTS